MQPGYYPRLTRCSVFPQHKKYMDYESGKYIRDKLEKISSHSLGDIIDDDIHNNMRYSDRAPKYYYYDDKPYIEDSNPSEVYNIPKFIPKDDFDNSEVIKKLVLEKEALQKKYEELEYQRVLSAAEESIKKREKDIQIVGSKTITRDNRIINKWVVK